MQSHGAMLRQLPTAELTASELSALYALFSAACAGRRVHRRRLRARHGRDALAGRGRRVDRVARVGRPAAAGGGRSRAAHRISRGGRDAARGRAAGLRVDGGPRRGEVPASPVRARGALDERPRVLPPHGLGGVARADVRAHVRPARRTEDDDGGIFILRTPSTPSLDLTDPLACDWRIGRRLVAVRVRPHVGQGEDAATRSAWSRSGAG